MRAVHSFNQNKFLVLPECVLCFKFSSILLAVGKSKLQNFTFLKLILYFGEWEIEKRENVIKIINFLHWNKQKKEQKS